MTDLGAFFIGVGIWWGLWALGNNIELDSAAYRLQQAVEYVVDNWGALDEEPDPEIETELSKEP